MALSLPELFRVLASFAPPKADLRGAPWEPYVDWAIAQGLASLAAYNLEYRAGLSGAPQWARDRLLALHQGTANDNVMKLVNFKRSVDELEGRKVVLFGGGVFAESLYPHIAFRPIDELRLLVPKGDVEGLAGFLRHAQFKAAGTQKTPFILSDGRTQLVVHDALGRAEGTAEGLLARAEPLKMYGPSMYRFSPEDALLSLVLGLEANGFEAPMIELVDLRELVLGAPSTGSAFSRALDPQVVASRAEAAKVERALWCALQVTTSLFPETEAACERLMPSIPMPVREVLKRVVVLPVSTVGRTQGLKGEEIVRHVALGL